MQFQPFKFSLLACIWCTLLLVVISCTSTEEKHGHGWILTEGENWTMSTPPSWDVDTQGDYGTHLIASVQPESDEDQFYENIALASAYMGDKIESLEDLTKANVSMLQQNIENWELEISEPAKISEREAWHLIYTGKQGIFDCRWEQFYLQQEGNFWVITLSAEQRMWQQIHDEALQSMISLNIQ